MAFISWTEAYSMGNPMLYGHRKRLFEIINTPHEQALSHKGKEHLQAAVKELQDYTVY